MRPTARRDQLHGRKRRREWSLSGRHPVAVHNALIGKNVLKLRVKPDFRTAREAEPGHFGSPDAEIERELVNAAILVFDPPAAHNLLLREGAKHAGGRLRIAPFDAERAVDRRNLAGELVGSDIRHLVSPLSTRG